MGLLDFLNPFKEVAGMVGGAAKFVGERLLPPKKMSESEKVDKYVKVFAISEGSTDSARQMFATEMRTQKQPLLIKYLNGLVRPFGGLGALTTEFYVIWGENLGVWFDFEFRKIVLDTSQHLILGSIIAFYFGSRLKETLTGFTTKR